MRPTTRLRSFVRRVTTVVSDGAPRARVYRRLPSPETELLVHISDGRVDLKLAGPRGTPLESRPGGVGSTVLVRFVDGGAYPFFGRPLAELADQFVPLADLWPAARIAPIAAAVDAVAAEAAVLAALEAILSGGAAYEPWSAVAVRRAVRRVRAASTLPTVAELAAEVGVSDRHLRRGFGEVVGMPPKRFLRVVRFRRALSLHRAEPRLDWAAVARRAGYFDQAHLANEVRALTGRPPSRLRPKGEGAEP